MQSAPFQIIGTFGSADPTDEEVAAILAALLVLRATAQASSSHQPRSGAGWHVAARLLAQGLTEVRRSPTPSWGTIERLRRAGPGRNGITGL